MVNAIATIRPGRSLFTIYVPEHVHMDVDVPHMRVGDWLAKFVGWVAAALRASVRCSADLIAYE